MSIGFVNVCPLSRKDSEIAVFFFFAICFQKHRGSAAKLVSKFLSQFKRAERIIFLLTLRN